VSADEPGLVVRAYTGVVIQSALGCPRLQPCIRFLRYFTLISSVIFSRLAPKVQHHHTEFTHSGRSARPVNGIPLNGPGATLVTWVVPKALVPSVQSTPLKRMVPLSVHCYNGSILLVSILLGFGALSTEVYLSALLHTRHIQSFELELPRSAKLSVTM
jgi:hypothetical protein